MAETALELTDDQIDQLLQDAEARLSSQVSRSEKSVMNPAKKVVAKTAAESETASSAPSTGEKSKQGVEHELSVRVPVAKKSKKEFTAERTAWYQGLPRTVLTPELKRDLQLLKMRSILDPKRHYKKDNSKSAVPLYSQGPTEFFSARLTKKERKRTLLEEVLETEDTTRRFKAKYGEIQAKKTSGKKGYYKKMTQKRYGSKR